MTEREAMLLLAEAAGWPRVPPYVIEGELLWRKALSGHTDPTPAERERLLDAVGAPWLSAELLATEPARERLRRWAQAGDLSDTPAGRREVAAKVSIVGDDLLAPLVRRALERLPPPALDHVRRHAIVLPVGLALGGFCSVLPAAAADASEARRLLVCNYPATADDPERAFLGIVAHEVAHHWLCEAPPEDLQPRSEAERVEAVENHRALLACARAWELLGSIARPAEVAEHQACRLAAAWGFAGSAADGRMCARNARRAILGEASALPPLDR